MTTGTCTLISDLLDVYASIFDSMLTRSQPWNSTYSVEIFLFLLHRKRLARRGIRESSCVVVALQLSAARPAVYFGWVGRKPAEAPRATSLRQQWLIWRTSMSFAGISYTLSIDAYPKFGSDAKHFSPSEFCKERARWELKLRGGLGVGARCTLDRYGRSASANTPFAASPLFRGNERASERRSKKEGKREG